MRRGAVFIHEDPLPCPQIAPSPVDWNRDRRARENRTNVRRHVVEPLVDMAKKRVAVGNEPREKRVEIAPHVRRGVLANNQRCARMFNKNRAQTPRDRRTPNRPIDLIGDLISSTTSRRYLDFFGIIHLFLNLL